MSCGRFPGSWKRGALVAPLGILCAQLAAAQTKPTAVLVYERPEAASGCPDEQGVRNAVSARLGYDPFDVGAERTVVARIRRARRGLVADVEVRDASNRVSGSRRLASTKGDCRELAAAMDLALSIAIDPLVLSRPEPSPVTPAPPTASPAPPTPAPPPPPNKSSRDPRNKVSLRASLGAVATLGSAPAITGGFTAQIGLRWRLASFGLEGRADIPASADIAGLGRVKTSLLLVSFVPCAHWRFLLGCALVSLGSLQGAGEDVAEPRQESTFYAAAGTRLGTELHLVKFLYLRIHLDLLATLTRTTLRIDGKDAWTTPPVSGDLGLSFAANFL